jgi:hypothetical protein
MSNFSYLLHIRSVRIDPGFLRLDPGMAHHKAKGVSPITAGPFLLARVRLTSESHVRDGPSDQLELQLAQLFQTAGEFVAGLQTTEMLMASRDDRLK